MKPENNNSKKPDFSSLSKIMEHFNNVPYSQFQQEIDAWFTDGMQSRGEVDPEFLGQLKELASSIYHEVEVMQLLRDAEVGKNHKNHD